MGWTFPGCSVRGILIFFEVTEYGFRIRKFSSDSGVLQTQIGQIFSKVSIVSSKQYHNNSGTLQIFDTLEISGI